MQPRIGYLAVEPLPDRDRDVLSRRQRGLKLGNLKVQMAMIVDADHLALQDLLHVLEIDHEAAHRIDLTRNRHLERVVVAMSIAVRALTEYALVLILRPG